MSQLQITNDRLEKLNDISLDILQKNKSNVTIWYSYFHIAYYKIELLKACCRTNFHEGEFLHEDGMHFTVRGQDIAATVTSLQKVK